jgi:large subunit ribosomal protein L10Ae
MAARPSGGFPAPALSLRMQDRCCGHRIPKPPAFWRELKNFSHPRGKMDVQENAELSIISTTKLASSVEKIKAGLTQEQLSTVQIQVNLKGYDSKKDNKLSKDIIFPHRIRRTDKTVVIVDKENIEQCRELGVRYGLIDELMREDKKEEREKLFEDMCYFILYPGYNKVYQLKNILRVGKIPYLMKHTDDLAAVYDTGNRTFKLRIVDMAITSFVAGHTQMPTDDIVDNVKAGLNLLLSYLKKGDQNVKKVFIKADRAKPIAIY